MSDLAAFQDQFSRALRRNVQVSDPRGFAPAGLQVYRNTVAAGLIDALAANFPTVARLVGDDWFASAARAFAEQYRPLTPMLVDYGEAFPEFLRAEGSDAMPAYLPDVARIDWLWTRAHTAADEPTLGREALAGLDPAVLFAARLRLHPATSIDRFATPAVTIWRLNRPPAARLDSSPQIRWRGEGALVTRRGGRTQVRALGAGGHALLSALVNGLPLGDAAVAALEADDEISIPQLLNPLFDAGAFSTLIMESCS